MKLISGLIEPTRKIEGNILIKRNEFVENPHSFDFIPCSSMTLAKNVDLFLK